MNFKKITKIHWIYFYWAQ